MFICCCFGFLLACLMLLVHIPLTVRAWKDDIDLLTKFIFILLAAFYIWGGCSCLMLLIKQF